MNTGIVPKDEIRKELIDKQKLLGDLRELQKRGGYFDAVAETSTTKKMIVIGDGWYEFNYEPETNWRLTEKVTHWTPLPEAIVRQHMLSEAEAVRTFPIR